MGWTGLKDIKETQKLPVPVPHFPKARHKNLQKRGQEVPLSHLC